MTIKEKRENLRRLVVAVNRSSDHQIMEAVDVLMLAVLDEFQFSEKSYSNFRRHIEKGTL